MTATYRSSPIRARRSGREIGEIRAAIIRALLVDQPMTLRQLFYRLVSEGVIGKTEQEYKSTVGRLLLEMRRDGSVPYEWIADNTRWMRKPRSFDSVADLLESSARLYRRSVWNDQPVYVEVWLEKDALAGVLLDVTARWDVPLMVSRGYASESFLYSAAETIISQDRPTWLYYFGDWDPSGRDIPRAIETSLRRMAPDAEIHFERVAVNADQIVEWNLPTRPTKTTDSRSATFAGESVEVDAIPPDALRDLARACLERHVPEAELQRLEVVEREERESLARVAAGWREQW